MAALDSLPRRHAGQCLPVEALSELSRAMADRPSLGEAEAARWLDERVTPRGLSSVQPETAPDVSPVVDGDVAQQCHAAIAEELRRAAQESETEVLGAGAKLANIYSETSAHAAGLKAIHARFLDQANTKEETLGGVVAAQAATLSVFPAAFDNICERLDEQRELAASASSHTSQILSLASAIDKITATINILGINALITAVHAGEHGAAFSVVANELRMLSAKTKTANASITSLAYQLSQALPKLSASGEEISVLCREKSSQLKEAVVEFSDKLGSTYREIQSSMVSAIEDSARRSEAIAANCNDVLSHLQFQDRVQQRMMSAQRISDLWLGAIPVEGDVADAIERFRVGAERLSRFQGSVPRGANPGLPVSKQEAGEDAGELNFL